MVVDSGYAGLEQSVHHLLVGASMYASSQRTSSKEGVKEKEGVYKDLLRPFKDYMIPGKEGGFVAKLREVLVIRQNASGASTVVELNNLQTTVKALAKTVKEALPKLENTPKKTWAAVAKGVYSTSEGAVYTPKVVIPERRTREIVVQALGQSKDLAKRTPAQVVEAVNKALGGDSAVAARRMQSGDIVLMFIGNAEGFTKETV